MLVSNVNFQIIFPVWYEVTRFTIEVWIFWLCFLFSYPEQLDELWHLRHCQLRTWIHDNLCYLTINCDSGQHSQFLRCFRHWECIVNRCQSAKLFPKINLNQLLLECSSEQFFSFGLNLSGGGAHTRVTSLQAHTYMYRGRGTHIFRCLYLSYS